MLYSLKITEMIKNGSSLSITMEIEQCVNYVRMFVHFANPIINVRNWICEKGSHTRI